MSEITTLLSLLCASSVLFCDALPRFVRSTNNDQYVTVTTRFGDLRGRTYNISESTDLDIFLGVPYALPPTGDLRLARPQPVQPWRPAVKDATVHGAKCQQRIITSDPVLHNVPFSEDCLFLDIYTTRRSDDPGTAQPVMVYIHPGGYYGGTGAKYNFTNLALEGVVVVSVSYRLDAFGFLSTQDDIIPGNFGLLDAALALEFVKETIGDFGGDHNDITLFGASSGAAMVSIFMISPLTKGTFQKAIMQSGTAITPWAVFTPGRVVNVPRDIAFDLGQRLNCTLPSSGNGTGSREDMSRALLTCLRAVPVDVLVTESVAMQYESYRGGMVFIPVSGDSFGLLPKPPEVLLNKTDDLVAIPTIQGYSTKDGSWLVSDPQNDGTHFQEIEYFVNGLIRQHFPPTDWNRMFVEVMDMYFPKDPTRLTPIELREILINVTTDFSQEAFVVKQARMMSQAKYRSSSSGEVVNKEATARTFVYEFNYRPSYAQTPLWYGAGHADEKGFVLGLTPGPDPFNYPNTTDDDTAVADIVTTMWTNFAKFGDPTPEPVGGVTWETFGHSTEDQNLLLIRPNPKMVEYKKNETVVVWTGSSGLVDSAAGINSPQN